MENSYPGSLSFVNSYLGVDNLLQEKSGKIRIVSPEI